MLCENEKLIMELYGVQYHEKGSKEVIESREDDLYSFKCYIGDHTISVEKGDSVILIENDSIVKWLRGPLTVNSEKFGLVLRGYSPENKTSELNIKTTLPYVNGCSTRQIFPPERLGDPTVQFLEIPAYTKEQAHHIHSTARVVYVLKGRGKSIVGMEQKHVIEELTEGKVVILDKMSPHHFETEGEPLMVIPIHIFSSVGALESNHPMFNGTHMLNQGL